MESLNTRSSSVRFWPKVATRFFKLSVCFGEIIADDYA
jgi:hypothetical protein